jgi:polar amino acid transport system substrate-binding protein
VSRAAAGLVLACAVAVALSGCGTVSTRAQDRSLRALATPEPKPGKGLKFGTPTKQCDDDPYGSLRAASLPAPGHMPRGTPMRRIQRDGELRAGVDQNSLGLGYYNPNTDSTEGFDIDLVREIARAIFGSPERVRYVGLSTEQRNTAITQGRVDIVASAYSVTCERRTKMRFSSIYGLANQRLLVRLDSKITGLNDPRLRGKRVCVTRASTSFKKLLRKSSGAKALSVELRSDCLVALQEGRAAAITSDDTILLGFKRQDPLTKIVGPAIEQEHYGIAVNQDEPELVRFINGVLRRLRRNGCLRAMHDHWLSKPKVLVGDRAYERCTRGSR